MRPITLGAIGEAESVYYLKQNGYAIVCTNYKTPIGEIDIIAKEKDRLIFIEVKNRSTYKFGEPREAVNTAKQKKIRLVATFYLKQHKAINSLCRFDVIEVSGDKITHLKNCF